MREKPIKAQELVLIVNSQQEFWHREFQGIIYEKDDSYQESILKVIALGYCPIFQLDNSLSEFEFLATLPKDSIIVWCHADESYDLKFNRRISEISAIKMILRPYRLNKFRLRSFLRSLIQTVVNLRYSKNFNFFLKILLWQIRGFSMQYRQWKIRRMYFKSRKKFLNILIGYTNIFAVSLVNGKFFSHASPDRSLFELLSKIEHEFGGRAITFTGQIGQVVRETAIRALSTFPESFLICRDTYGASNVLEKEVRVKGAEYVDSLKSSCFILCPPGNISGESFRIFETILMRRIPVAMSSVTSDPSYELPYKFVGPWHSRYSWGAVIKQAIGTDPAILRDVAFKNFYHYQEEIQKTQMILRREASLTSSHLGE